jgi:hypothetical protein
VIKLAEMKNFAVYTFLTSALVSVQCDTLQSTLRHTPSQSFVEGHISKYQGLSDPLNEEFLETLFVRLYESSEIIRERFHSLILDEHSTLSNLFGKEARVQLLNKSTKRLVRRSRITPFLSTRFIIKLLNDSRRLPNEPRYFKLLLCVLPIAPLVDVYGMYKLLWVLLDKATGR